MKNLRERCEKLAEGFFFTPGRDHYNLSNEIESFAKELVEPLEAELETERMRLVGCGVAAMSNTGKTVSERITRGNPYWSASYGDVCAAVDREMQLRAELDQWKELHEKSAAMVIPGETDSADAYRKMYFQLRARIEELELVAAFPQSKIEAQLRARITKLEKALKFYLRWECKDDFQNRFNNSDQWIECQVTYKGPSSAGEALRDSLSSDKGE